MPGRDCRERHTAGQLHGQAPRTGRGARLLPLYEALIELDIPAMAHVSDSCNPIFHFTGAHYINADTAAFIQRLRSESTGHYFYDTRRYIDAPRGSAGQTRKKIFYKNAPQGL